MNLFALPPMAHKSHKSLLTLGVILAVGLAISVCVPSAIASTKLSMSLPSKQVQTAKPILHGAQAVTAGGDHTCAILLDRTVKCWGSNSNGQLGDGSTRARRLPPTAPVDLGRGEEAISVAAGTTHTCAVLRGGAVKCWGMNYFGQLGDGSNTDRVRPGVSPVNLGSHRHAVAISAGEYHTCAVLDDGELKCWGLNMFGQLGIGNTTSQNLPPAVGVDLGPNRSATLVATGFTHTCAVLDDGSVKCWGANTSGQLGFAGAQQIDRPPSRPIDFGSPLKATSISADGIYAPEVPRDHTCAGFSGGTVRCWGYPQAGQLGTGSSTSSNAPPLQKTSLPSSIKQATSGTLHNCAVSSKGSVYCWGWNAYGQLGDGSTTSSSTAQNPIDLASGSTASSVTAGFEHTCVLLKNHSVKCWGNNNAGQLGVPLNSLTLLAPMRAPIAL